MELLLNYLLPILLLAAAVYLFKVTGFSKNSTMLGMWILLFISTFIYTSGADIGSGFQGFEYIAAPIVATGAGIIYVPLTFLLNK